MKESFADMSGNNDASGNIIKVSIKDLITLLNVKAPASKAYSSSNSYDSLRNDLITKQEESDTLYGTNQDKSNDLEGSNYYSAFKKEILQEVRSSVRDELQKKQEGNVLSDSCIDSVANQQGTDWMRYIPGKNPDDYIRKDSIPCYACNLK